MGLFENVRAREIIELNLLNSNLRTLFLDAVAQAATITGRPVAMLNVITAGHQVTQACYGIDHLPEMERDWSVCHHTIMGRDIMEVPDLRTDLRFAGNDIATGRGQVQSYVGIPLLSGRGFPVGALCALGPLMDELTGQQKTDFRELARVTMMKIESRRVRDEKTQSPFGFSIVPITSTEMMFFLRQYPLRNRLGQNVKVVVDSTVETTIFGSRYLIVSDLIEGIRDLMLRSESDEPIRLSNLEDGGICRFTAVQGAESKALLDLCVMR